MLICVSFSTVHARTTSPFHEAVQTELRWCEHFVLSNITSGGFKEFGFRFAGIPRFSLLLSIPRKTARNGRQCYQFPDGFRGVFRRVPANFSEFAASESGPVPGITLRNSTPWMQFPSCSFKKKLKKITQRCIIQVLKRCEFNSAADGGRNRVSPVRLV